MSLFSDQGQCQCTVCQEERAAAAAAAGAPPQTMEEKFKARLITPIPDDECTDMGDYVIWNKYDPSCTLISTYQPSNLVRDISPPYDQYSTDSRREQNFRAHLTKPVLLSGWFKVGDFEYFYYVSSFNEQRRVMYSRYGSPYRSDQYPDWTVTKDTITPCTPSRVARVSRVLALLDKHAPPNLGYRRQQANALLSEGTPPGIVEYRGQMMMGPVFVIVRNLMAKAGEVIRNECNDGSGDVDELCEIVESLRRWRPDFGGSIVSAWNDICKPYDEITIGYCGHVFTTREGNEVHGGRTVCDSCIRDDYVCVEDSDGYFHRDDVYLHSDDNYYTYPDRSDYGDDDDDLPYVRNYSDDVLRYLPRDHTIKPSSYGEFLMGIELETTAPRHSYAAEAARHTSGSLCQGYAIMKRDGSIGDNGFEIVTAPRGLKEHIERFGKWTPHDKMRAWDGGRCGLHVHISSQAFTQATLGKFVEFITAPENTGLILRIAGRHHTTDSNAESYCGGEQDLVKGNPKKTLSYKSSSRYTMVNTTNLTYQEASRLGVAHSGDGEINTVELRIFRASLKKARLLAQIEFAHAAVMFCRWSSMRELREDHFMAWLKKSAGSYPNLARWFGVRSNTDVVAVLPAVADPVEV